MCPGEGHRSGVGLVFIRAAHSVRPCCNESPLCSQDGLEIAHHCTKRHSCGVAAHGSEIYCPCGFNLRNWVGEAWSC